MKGNGLEVSGGSRSVEYINGISIRSGSNCKRVVQVKCTEHIAGSLRTLHQRNRISHGGRTCNRNRNGLACSTTQRKTNTSQGASTVRTVDDIIYLYTGNEVRLNHCSFVCAIVDCENIVHPVVQPRKETSRISSNYSIARIC